MTRPRALIVAFVTIAIAVLTAQADISRLGLQVADKALDFRLGDQEGHIQSLKTVAGPKGTMLVFFRSADW